MSQQKVYQRSTQINASVAAVTLDTPALGAGAPADIVKIIFANTSATPCMVTLSDGVNNYYYEVPANATVRDENIPSDVGGTSWTATCASSVNSLYISAIFN